MFNLFFTYLDQFKKKIKVFKCWYFKHNFQLELIVIKFKRVTFELKKKLIKNANSTSSANSKLAKLNECGNSRNANQKLLDLEIISNFI